MERWKALVTGANGMLGSQIVRDAPEHVTALGTDIDEADLAEPDQVEALFKQRGPFQGVIHAAAFTAVDLAEERESEALRANARATQIVAEACARSGIPLVVVSTDFVFNGRSQRPYREDDIPDPLGAYGRTKYAGELAARAAHPRGTRIVRTQWLYGPRGQHFPATMLRLAEERDELKVVDDQVGSPTSTLELAPALWDVLLRGEPGVYHGACAGECSWYVFARAIFEIRAIRNVHLQPCTTAEFPRPAPRPAYSVLDSARLTALRGRPLAPWREALATYLNGKEQ